MIERLLIFQLKTYEYEIDYQNKELEIRFQNISIDIKLLLKMILLLSKCNFICILSYRIK